MKKLPNNCRRSDIRVYPKNWQTCRESAMSKNWYIKYTFYDDNLMQSKQVMIKANKLNELEARRAQVQTELRNLHIALEENGYNPITKSKKISWVETKAAKVYAHTPFIDALNFAYSKLKLADSTMKDIRLVIDNVKASLPGLQLTHLTIGSVAKGDLRAIIEDCAHLKTGAFSDDKYNRHRTYLGILYTELIEFDAVEVNLPYNLKKKAKAIKKQREVLTAEQRQKIDVYLKEKFFGYWRFVHIFFTSGARETEIMRVRVKDVDIKRQRVKYLIKKGKTYREEFRTIPDSSLQLWKDAIAGASPEWFVFSDNKLAGPREVRADSINTFWYRHCKKALGVQADFYSLKHLNTTETRKKEGIKLAALQNAESEDMIKKHYDVDHEEDELVRLRKIDNKFA